MSKPLIPEIRFNGYDDEWQQAKVKDVFTLGNGYTPSKSNPRFWTNGTIPWFRMEDIRENGRVLADSIQHVTPEAVKSSGLFPAGSIIVSTTATIGEHALLIADSLANQRFTVFQTVNRWSWLKANYLLYRFYGLGEWCRRNVNSGGLAAVNISDLQKYDIDFPSTEDERSSIANFFTNLDKLITEVTRELDRLEKMKLASLQKMFPRPGTNTPEIRFAGFEGEWDVKKIGEIFSEGNARGCNGTPLSVSIARGVYPTEDFVKTVTVKDFSNYKRVDEGDIVYNSMRMWQGASGVSYWRGFVSPAYTVLRPREDEHICSEFFAYLFKLDWVIKIFEANSQGLTKDTWNLKYPAISQIELPIPNDGKEQFYIAEYFRNIDTLIAAKREKLAKLRNIKKSCLDKMFVNISDL